MTFDFVRAAIGTFFNTLRLLAPGLVGRVLLGLGLGLSSYTVLVPELLAWVQTFFNALDGGTLQLLGYLNVDRAFNLIVSAVAFKLGLRVNLIRLGGTP